MLKALYLIPLVALMADGGVSLSPSSPSGPDVGAVSPQPLPPPADGGTFISPAMAGQSFPWPDEARPVATLDGPAVLAANAALQYLLARLAKDHPGECGYSAKAMKVNVSEANGLYFVSIERHVDRCGWAGPGFNPDLHWWEVYAVTPDGRVLARNPYAP